jgi:hypothetical protein
VHGLHLLAQVCQSTAFAVRDKTALTPNSTGASPPDWCFTNKGLDRLLTRIAE